MPRSTSPEPPHPTRLAVAAEAARASIRARLEAADPLLKVTVVYSPQELEVHSGQVKSWSDVTYELLRRLFDSDEYADSFLMAHRSYVRSYMTNPSVLFEQTQESLRNQFRELQTTLAKVDVLEEIPNPVRPATASSATSTRPGPAQAVHVSHSTIGTFNLGDIQGSIKNKINTLAPSATDFKTALARVLDAAMADPSLDESQKREVLEDLDYLAEQSTLEPAERKIGLAATVLAGLGRVLSFADQANKVWQEWQPIVSGFLTGHHG